MAALAGRSAVVTGSTSGIGLGIAARFAAAGANVMLNGFGDAEEIERIRRDLAVHGTKVAYHGADMARPGEIAALVVCPGWVLTPLVDRQIHARAETEGKSYEQARLALVAEKQPSKEFVTPEQIAELALFLRGDAAVQIRGQAIAVDGGWTAQ